MGKMRNARRNPGITWLELRELGHGERMVTCGEEYAIVGVGGLGKSYRLVSPNGVSYSMYVRSNGVVEPPVLVL